MKNTKRFMALLLALVLVFSSMTTAFAAVSEDVVGTEFEAVVGKLNAVGVMEGYPDGTFKPEGEITRAEFAAIAIRALGLGDAAEVSKANTIFTDVNAFHWAAGYINLAVDRGVIKGYPDGTYRPSNPLTNAEAITILTRLVGLGPVIDKQGTWPANYISAANNEGILKGVNVASSVNSTRGIAAKMLANALEVQKWGATGYDNDGSVSYGKLWNDDDEVTLLNDNLEITEVEGRLMSTSTDEIEIDTTTYDYVGADFDAEYLFLNEVDAWVNADDEVIYMIKTSTQLFDAIEFDGDEVTLVEADDDYDLLLDDEELDIILYVNGEDQEVAGDDHESLDEDSYDYAKVVLNSKDKVVAISAYNWEDFLVVDEVDDNDVIGLGEVVVDAEDFTIVKAGMTITLDDLEEGDIFYYNSDSDIEYAEVFNRTVEGEIEDIFVNDDDEDMFEVDDEEYKFINGIGEEVVYYVNEDGDYSEFDFDAAKQMEDEEEAVTLFLTRGGEVVFVVGELGEVETSTVAGILLDDVATDESFGRLYVEFDFVNELGTKVSTTVRVSNLDEVDGDEATDELADSDFDDYVAGSIVEFVYDEDGDIIEVELQTAEADVIGDELDTVETDDKYIDGNRLSSSTVVFFVDGLDLNDIDTIDEDDVEVINWADVEADIEDGLFYTSDDKVSYIVAVGMSEEEDDVIVVVDGFRLNTDLEVTRVTAWSEAGATTYSVDKVAQTITAGAIVVLTVEEDTDLVTAISMPDAEDVVDAETVVSRSRTDRTITTDTDTFRLVSDAIILDVTDPDDIDTMKLSDVEAGHTVTFVLDAADSVYVKMVLVNTTMN